MYKSDGAGNLLSGATFGIWTGSAASGAPFATCTTFFFGDCVFISLFPGTFTVEELRPPPGYIADPSPQSVTLQVGSIAVLTFVDQPQ